MNLTAAHALVTGAGRRLGRAIAEELGRAGASVTVHYNASEEGAEATCAAIVRGGGRARAVKADLRDASSCATLVDEARRAFGPLAVLVNSAAAFERARFEDIDDDAFAEMLALNLLAPARLIRLALPDMRALGSGVVVNILDVAALGSWTHHAHYTSSKAALLMLTKTLAAELAPAVRVVGVAPGTAAFPADYDQEARARVLSKIPLGRVGAPTDVARAVRFLVEEDFLTGVVLPVDGGRLVGGGGQL